ncbi:hypothetical protein HK103_005022 [Boothiomyces macroporosus]|uniref:Uncharacterized protein n=1 Tax=Boothiomyces macroporosus TaxID=261099 RepID=A0AAD5UIU9_9FUNG|nr:hypothetical protein HK103_005022 [Boothiomyces macroporosus]
MFIAIHAGAGYHSPKNTPKYKKLMSEVCLKSMDYLKKGNSSLDTIKYCIGLLETNELTNAGISGSNLTISGSVECDASLMTADGFASVGAVPMLSEEKIHPSPIGIAHKLYLNLMNGVDVAGRQPPLMLAGREAHQFAESLGLTMITKAEANSLITTGQKKRYEHHMDILKRATKIKTGRDYLQDTVGAIVVDAQGNMVTGVSSGGISLKVPGRIGEAGYPGSGIWIIEEDETTIACTLSGTGEQIMKTFLATSISNILINSVDLPGDLETLLIEKFLKAKVLAKEQIDKNVGALIVRKASDNIECWWGHTTPSFCLAFVNENSKVTFRMSRKNSGRRVCVGGTSM